MAKVYTRDMLLDPQWFSMAFENMDNKYNSQKENRSKMAEMFKSMVSGASEIGKTGMDQWEQSRRFNSLQDADADYVNDPMYQAAKEEYARTGNSGALNSFKTNWAAMKKAEADKALADQTRQQNSLEAYNMSRIDYESAKAEIENIKTNSYMSDAKKQEALIPLYNKLNKSEIAMRKYANDAGLYRDIQPEQDAAEFSLDFPKETGYEIPPKQDVPEFSSDFLEEAGYEIPPVGQNVSTFGPNLIDSRQQFETFLAENHSPEEIAAYEIPEGPAFEGLRTKKAEEVKKAHEREANETLNELNAFPKGAFTYTENDKVLKDLEEKVAKVDNKNPRKGELNKKLAQLQNNTKRSYNHYRAKLKELVNKKLKELKDKGVNVEKLRAGGYINIADLEKQYDKEARELTGYKGK